MKKLLSIKNAFFLTVASVGVLGLSMSAYAESVSFKKILSKKVQSIKRVKGVPVTGPNQFCGQLRWSFEDQGINPLSFSQVGAFDPNSDQATGLTPENCITDQLLATIHDPVISNDPPAIVQVPNIQLQNIPLRDVPKVGGVPQGGTTGLRMPVDRAPAVPANPFPVYASGPDDDITLGKWVAANGRLTYRCFDDGTATVRARFSNLIANGVYSVWGIWRTALPNGFIVSLPSPFGGVPNAIVPDEYGRASFRRDLPFCPDEETQDGSLLLWVAVAYHSDSALYAGVPDAADVLTQFVSGEGVPFESTLSLMVHHEQMAFPINFTSEITP